MNPDQRLWLGFPLWGISEERNFDGTKVETVLRRADPQFLVRVLHRKPELMGQEVPQPGEALAWLDKEKAAVCLVFDVHL